MAVKVISQDVRTVRTEALIVGCYEDVRPLKGLAGELDWLLCGALSRLLLKKNILGSLGDVALLTSQGKVPAAKIFLIGLGQRQTLSAAAVQSAARNAVASAVSAGVRQAAMECFPLSGTGDDPAFMTALVKGVAEGVDGHGLDLSLLAPDAAACERISRTINS